MNGRFEQFVKALIVLIVILVCVELIEIWTGTNIYLKSISILSLIILAIVSLFFHRYVSASFTKYFGRVQSIINEDVHFIGREVDSLENLMETLRQSLTKVRNLVISISNATLAQESYNNLEFSNTENANTLSGHLWKLKSRLTHLEFQENQKRWSSEGMTRFAEILRLHDQSIELVLEKFVIEFCKYIKGNQAFIYLRDEVSAQLGLQLMVAYAYNRMKYVKKFVHPGEGLVGQVFLEEELIYMKEVPPDYVQITSGLGEALPRVIILVPLKFNDKVEGVIEIASFSEWEEHEINFIKDISEVLASSIASFRLNELTKDLLEQSKIRESRLLNQEEELRQNLEELNATQDAIEQKAQESLEQNRRFAAILNSTEDPIVTIDEKFVIESCNDASLSVFGYSNLIGTSIEVLFPKFYLSRIDSGFNRNLHNSEQSNHIKFISEGRRQDGSIFPIDVIFSRVNLGNRILYTGVIRNISERVRLELEQSETLEALRNQEEELRQNMEELVSSQEELARQLQLAAQLNAEFKARMTVLNESTILSESDLFGTITFVNDKFCQVSQYSFEELVGRPHKILRHSDMPKELFELLWRTIKNGKTFRGYVKNRKKNGDAYYVDAIISPVLDEWGKPVKYIGARYVIEDVALGERLLASQWDSIQNSLTAKDEEFVVG